MDKSMGDYPILVPETMTIYNANVDPDGYPLSLMVILI